MGTDETCAQSRDKSMTMLGDGKRLCHVFNTWGLERGGGDAFTDTAQKTTPRCRGQGGNDENLEFKGKKNYYIGCISSLGMRLKSI